MKFIPIEKKYLVTVNGESLRSAGFLFGVTVDDRGQVHEYVYIVGGKLVYGDVNEMQIKGEV